MYIYIPYTLPVYVYVYNPYMCVMYIGYRIQVWFGCGLALVMSFLRNNVKSLLCKDNKTGLGKWSGILLRVLTLFVYVLYLYLSTHQHRTKAMQKLFMLQTALNNLVASGEAEVVHTGWVIELEENGDRLYIDCDDDGFTAEIYFCEEEIYTDAFELGSVSQLRALIAQDYEAGIE